MTMPESKAEKGLGHYVVIGLSAALLLAVLALAVVVIVIPKLSGATPLTVLTSSMEPTLPPGTLIVVQPVDVTDLAVGDVATYQIRSGEPDVITHRAPSSSRGTTTATRTRSRSSRSRSRVGSPIRCPSSVG
jgi:signal peptidase I